MNIYLISQTLNDGHDTFESAVVIAKDEDQARHTHPRSVDEPWNEASEVWAPARYVVVEFVGKAPRGAKRAVVCASFNAG